MGNPRRHGRARRLRNLELYRATGLLLKDEGAGRHALTMADVAYPQLHKVAGPELAVDSQVEKGKISTATCDMQSYANRPYLLEFECSFLAHELPFVPGFSSNDCGAGFHNRLLLVGSLQF